MYEIEIVNASLMKWIHLDKNANEVGQHNFRDGQIQTLKRDSSED